jgi:hypothetical protein
MAKFICEHMGCPNEGKEFEYLNYKSKVKKHGTGMIYMDKNFKEIVCLVCGDPLGFIQPKVDGFPQVVTETFNSMSPERKRDVLTKRSQEHSKRKLKEYKKYANNGGEEPYKG